MGKPVDVRELPVPTKDGVEWRVSFPKSGVRRPSSTTTVQVLCWTWVPTM